MSANTVQALKPSREDMDQFLEDCRAIGRDPSIRSLAQMNHAISRAVRDLKGRAERNA